MTGRLRHAILLPPSAGKATGGDGSPWAPGTTTLAGLDEQRAEVLAAMGGGVASEPTLPAIERYTGVLYRELDWSSLPASARRRGRAQLLVASGLLGMVGPGDPVPPYRLAMGDRLPGLGKLSSWWRDPLTAALADHLRGTVVWDLLPNEHAAAWRPADVAYRRRITVRFVDTSGRTVSHWNKLLKGALTRRLLSEPVTGPEELDGWEHPSGYRLDPSESTLDADPAVAVFAAR